MAEQAAKGKHEEMRRLAFLGWQMQAPFTKSRTFAAHLANLGLSEEPQVKPEPVERGAGLAIAQEVLARLAETE